MPFNKCDMERLPCGPGAALPNVPQVGRLTGGQKFEANANRLNSSSAYKPAITSSTDELPRGCTNSAGKYDQQTAKLELVPALHTISRLKVTSRMMLLMEVPPPALKRRAR